MSRSAGCRTSSLEFRESLVTSAAVSKRRHYKLDTGPCVVRSVKKCPSGAKSMMSIVDQVVRCVSFWSSFWLSALFRWVPDEGS